MCCIFTKTKNRERRCYNFENSTMERGCGGMSNKGAKGHAAEPILAGESKVICDIKGSGVIDHFWLTFKSYHGILDDFARRGLRIKMYWDGAQNPAVDVPIGDFFGLGMGQLKHYENELFSCLGGKSFTSYMKMPFLSGAKIIVENECDFDIDAFFYTIDYYLDADLKTKNPLYLHASWRREKRTELKKDFRILPKVCGNGIFLGCNVNVIANPDLYGAWWGEGEVKMYIDGDREYPTVVGTGAEDYIGTGWGLGEFTGRYSGCLSAVNRSDRTCYSFYRYHIPDPVYFENECCVTIQQIGGAEKRLLKEFKKNGAKFEVVSAQDDAKPHFVRMYENEQGLTWESDEIEDHYWCNIYRQDDFSATAYYYLDSAEGVAQPLAPLSDRLFDIERTKDILRDDQN